MKICCFASGSKGNCCLISDGRSNILIDMGISATRVEGFLKSAGVSPDGIDIFVTHTHSDHIGGLRVFCKKHPAARVHCQNEIAPELRYYAGVLPVADERVAEIGDLRITAVPVSHDVPCFGYVVKSDEKSVGIVTDIGEMDEKTLQALTGSELVVIESNHDENMLKANRNYSYELKKRILSRHGHLSNPCCAEACAFLAAFGTRRFVLAHISQENNTPSLALSAVNRSLNEAGFTDVKVIAALQDSPTEVIEL